MQFYSHYQVANKQPPPIAPPSWQRVAAHYTIFAVDSFKRPYICGAIYSDGSIIYMRDTCGRFIRYAHERNARIALAKWKLQQAGTI